MEPKQDYSGSPFKLAVAVILILVGISLLPRIGVGLHLLKKVNILAEILPNDSFFEEELQDDHYFDTTFLGETAMISLVETENIPEHKSQMWNAGGGEVVQVAEVLEVASRKVAEIADNVVPIEDFGVDARAMGAFYNALENKTQKRVVRIAVLGDSFIEGDLITADIREQLQDIYGGRGVGFVPFASAVAQYRGTIKHAFDKWTTYTFVEKKKVPEELKDKFFVSGMIGIPQEGAVTSLRGVTFRKHIKYSSAARIVFINENNSTLHVVVNDSLRQSFTPEASPHVQQIVVNGNIGSIDVRISHPDGFIGYGVFLEDKQGVGVDNYSVRGNSGLGLFDSSPSINRQINQMGKYDLVILQYGLNVMSADQVSYSNYAKSMAGVIKYIQQCFPESSVLVMGVGDRSTMRDGDFVTMPGVKGMIAAQRSAAKAAGVAFWDTFAGMGGENSMVAFVEKNWAAKDYTHIGFQGGRFIAKEFVKALMKDKYLTQEAILVSEPDFSSGHGLESVRDNSSLQDNYSVADSASEEEPGDKKGDGNDDVDGEDSAEASANHVRIVE